MNIFKTWEMFHVEYYPLYPILEAWPCTVPIRR